jgi:predicted Rossmann-fold nucleotide-binding protein
MNTEKAYKNLDFLTSKDARSLRILAEYLHPKAQFEKEKVSNTIVIFGSARAPSPEELNNREGFDEGREKDQKLAKYYDATRMLSKKLTEWSMDKDKDEQKYVICSGGGPGIMIAANRGAREANGKTASLRISLPFESAPNPYVNEELDLS